MTLREKVVDYHIARLQDKREDVRLDAVQQLELLEATEALEALQDLFKRDVSMQVRKAAQEAGRRLFLMQKKQQAG